MNLHRDPWADVLLIAVLDSIFESLAKTLNGSVFCWPPGGSGQDPGWECVMLAPWWHWPRPLMGVCSVGPLVAVAKTLDGSVFCWPPGGSGQDPGWACVLLAPWWQCLW